MLVNTYFTSPKGFKLFESAKPDRSQSRVSSSQAYWKFANQFYPSYALPRYAVNVMFAKDHTLLLPGLASG